MKRNFILTAVSMAIRLAASTVLFLVLARAWGPQTFGTFSFAFSLSALLMLFVDFGFPLFLLRKLAAEPKRAGELIEQGLRAKLFLTAGAAAAAGLVATSLGSDALPFVLFSTLTLAAVLNSFAEYFVAPLRALGRYDLEVLVATTGSALQLTLPGGVAWLGGTPVEAAASLAIGRLLYVVAASRALLILVPLSELQRSPQSIRQTLHRLLPYGMDSALTSAWSFIDVVAVRLLFGTEAVGIYAAGQKTMYALNSLAPIVGNVMVPHLARKAHSSEIDTGRAAILTGCLMASLGIILALPLFAFPSWISETLFGPNFLQLADWLPWFGAVLMVRYTVAGFGVVLSAIGLQRSRVVGQVAALTTYLACISVVALKRLGVEAAIASLLAAMTTMGIIFAMYIRLAAKQGRLGKR